MQRIDRRKFIGAATSMALAASLSGRAHANDLAFKPEPGAKLRLLRWKRFVEGDETAFVRRATRYFKIPPSRVVELGAEIEL